MIDFMKTDSEIDDWRAKIPRRIQLGKNSPAELAIRDAIFTVEATGTDVLLTEAVVLLQQAREKVADFIDGTE